MLLNSNEVQTKLSSAGGRAEQLANDARLDETKVDELFWAALARSHRAGNRERDGASQEARRQ